MPQNRCLLPGVTLTSSPWEKNDGASCGLPVVTVVLAMGRVGQRNGIDSVSYGSQTLGSLDWHPLALTAIFWLFSSLWLVCSSSVCLCVVWPQFWTWWCQDLDRPVKISPDAIISPSKSPPPAGVCRAVTRWIYSQQTEICSSVLLVSWGNLWVPQMSLFSDSCYFGWCESPAMRPVAERWDYPLRKAVGKKLL